MLESLRTVMTFYAITIPGTWPCWFKKTPEAEEMIRRSEEKEDLSSGGRIRCPLCRWQPDRNSRWFCADVGHPEYFFGGCWTSWNTFETRGRCPGCSHQWTWTSCLRCHGWSKHEEWYDQA